MLGAGGGAWSSSVVASPLLGYEDMHHEMVSHITQPTYSTNAVSTGKVKVTYDFLEVEENPAMLH